MGEDELRFSAQSPCGGSDDDSVSLSDRDHEKRYAELFRQLDLNKDGKVDISELRTALAARGLHQGRAEEVRQSNKVAHTNLPNQTDKNLAFRLNIRIFVLNLIEKLRILPLFDITA